MLKYFSSVLFLSCDFSMTITEVQLTFSHSFKTATKKLGFEIEPETRVMNLSAPPAIWLHRRWLGHSFQKLLPRNSVSQQNDIHLGMKLLPTDFTSGISLAFMTSVYSTLAGPYLSMASSVLSVVLPCIGSLNGFKTLKCKRASPPWNRTMWFLWVEKWFIWTIKKNQPNQGKRIF